MNQTNLFQKINCTAGDIYVKQFQDSGNLQLIGDWINHANAKVGVPSRNAVS